MHYRSTKLLILLSLFLSFTATSDAHAQATRTWVSGVGDDANPCSRTAPCKTFAGAISKTAAGGEINALDPAGFGAVTITKSISIESEGNLAGILVSGTNGITINAGASDRVVLRGLTFEGIGSGLNGVRILQAGSVFIEDCTINNFADNAVDVRTSADTNVFIKNTTIRNNRPTTGNGGVVFTPTGVAVARGVLDNVNIENNRVGLRINQNSIVTVRDSVISSSINGGITVSSSTAAAILSIESSTINGNGSHGIRSDGSAAIVRMATTSIFNNNAGLVADSGGQIFSFVNNHVFGNNIDGTATVQVALQ